MHNDNFYTPAIASSLADKSKQAAKESKKYTENLQKVIQENLELKDKVSALVITIRNLTEKLSESHNKNEQLQLECQNLMNLVNDIEGNRNKP